MRTIGFGSHLRFERRACFWSGVAEGGIFAGTVQEKTGLVRSGTRKETEVDYQRVNLRGCVQRETHIIRGAQWNSGETPKSNAETHNQRKASALVFADLSRAGQSSSSSLAGTVRLGVGERHRREIVIWSPQRPRAASNRLPVSAKSVRGRRPRHGLQARKAALDFILAKKTRSTCFCYFLDFFACAGVVATGTSSGAGEASRRSDVGLRRSSDAQCPANGK